MERLVKIAAASLVSVVSIVFCENVYSVDVIHYPYDEKQSEYVTEFNSGWEKKEGILKYKDKRGEYLSGWHFLPVFGQPDNYKWHYFDKDGNILKSFNPKRSTESNYFFPLVSRVSYNHIAEMNYEHVVLDQGWYNIKSIKDDGSTLINDPVFIKSYGDDTYGICRFENGKYVYMAPDGDYRYGNNLSFLNDSGGDEVKWSILKNKDSSITFINYDKGLALDLSETGAGLSLYEDSKVGQKIVLDEKVPARPEYYGAKGNGINDDTEAIEFAVNNNKEVVFSGNYNTSSCIVLRKDGVILKNEGGMIVTHPHFRTFEVKGKDIIFDSLIFKGNYSRDESTENSCIYFRTFREDAPVENYNTLIKGCSFVETGLRGIHFHSERVSANDFTPVSIISNIKVEDCLFDTYKIGVCCSGAEYITVDNCSFRNAFFEHITFDWKTRNSTVENCVFEGIEGGVGCVGLDAAENCLLKNNKFYSSRMYGITFNNELGTCKNIIIEGNTFENVSGKGGVYLSREYDRRVSGEQVQIKNNVFNTSDTYSVLIDSAAGDIELSGNKYNGLKPVINTESAIIKKDF